MRASGILMPISSLPSPYGIGTMGAAARSFVDFLVKAGQAYWQEYAKFVHRSLVPATSVDHFLQAS